MEQKSQVQITKTKSGAKRRKVGNILSTVALILAVILCLVVVGQVLGQGYVSLGGYSLFRVVTESMVPTLPLECLLISEKVAISDIQVDDIVVFRSKTLGGSTVTHRVTQIYQNANGDILLETKGDANPYADGSYVDQGNLIGRVIFYTKDGNMFAGLVNLLTSPMGFFASIVIPCLIIGVIIMRGTMTSIRKEMAALNQELNEQEKQEKEQKEKEEAEYEQLCNRLRAELLEELKQSADQEEKTE